VRGGWGWRLFDWFQVQIDHQKKPLESKGEAYDAANQRKMAYLRDLGEPAFECPACHRMFKGQERIDEHMKKCILFNRRTK
jgi:hypothetical protein